MNRMYVGHKSHLKPEFYTNYNFPMYSWKYHMHLERQMNATHTWRLVDSDYLLIDEDRI